MASERKLPIAFWALLFAAIAVALALVVGLILERKNDSPPKPNAATPSPAPGTENLPASAVAAMENAKNLKCSVEELQFAGGDALKTSRLVGWGLEPFQLTFWALDYGNKANPVFKKLTVTSLEPSSTSAKLDVSSEQKIVCDKFQEPGCLYVGASDVNGVKLPANEVADLQLERELGAVFVNPVGKSATSRAIVARVENGKLMFHETLGLCGNALEGPPEGLTFTVSGQDETRTLKVFDKELGGIFNYEQVGNKSYSRLEASLHPTAAQLADNTGLNSVDCKHSVIDSPSDAKRFVLRDINSIGDVTALIASGKKTFDSDQEVWLVDTSVSPAKLNSRLTKAKLGITPGNLMWRTPSRILVSSSNFFATSSNFREIELPAETISPSDFKDAWPAQNLRLRESQTSKSPSSEEQPLLVYKDAKKTSGAIRIHSQTLDLTGPFAPEETPRALLSKRSETEWLLLYQSQKSEPIRGARVNCL